ncbi:multidrug efflux pump subunit AcrB [Bradyrhizobium sp. F1.13.1]
MTISFNLAPGAAIGDAVSGIQSIEKQLHPPLSLQTSFQGNAQAFGASLNSTPILIAASLFVIYLILGVLYESLIFTRSPSSRHSLPQVSGRSCS